MHNGDCHFSPDDGCEACALQEQTSPVGIFPKLDIFAELVKLQEVQRRINKIVSNPFNSVK